MNIPLFISQIIATLLAGGLVTKIGYYNPWLIVGTICLSISTGLYTLFEVDTGSSAWIGFQVLNGLGIGFSTQIPVIAVQAVLDPVDIPIGMALSTFFQFFGSTIFIAIAQTVFTNRLVSEIAKNAPDVNQHAFLHAGSASVRNMVTSQQLPTILAAYNSAITSTFYVAVGASVAAVIASFGLEWKNVKAGNPNPESKA